MALIKTIIDGKEIEVERDRWALDVAREMGISIPTLCYHPALEPYGACRLCVVEVTKGKWTWLTTSCDLPIREGLSIKTNSSAVIQSRKMALDLLWSRAPRAEALEELGKELGIEKPRFTSRADIGKCILCGLCVRVCDKLIGASAISFVNRGCDRRVMTPFKETSDSCTGCNACVAVCPTGHIVSEDEGTTRQLKTWQTTVNLLRCELCEQAYLPEKEFKDIQARLSKIDLEKICPSCRRLRTVTKLTTAACGQV